MQCKNEFEAMMDVPNSAEVDDEVARIVRTVWTDPAIQRVSSLPQISWICNDTHALHAIRHGTVEVNTRCMTATAIFLKK